MNRRVIAGNKVLCHAPNLASNARASGLGLFLSAVFSLAGGSAALAQPFAVGQYSSEQFVSSKLDGPSLQGSMPLTTQGPSLGSDRSCGSNDGFALSGGMPSGSGSPDGPALGRAGGATSPGGAGGTSPSPASMASDAVAPQMSIDPFHMTPRLTIPGITLPNRIPMPVGELSYNGRYSIVDSTNPGNDIQPPDEAGVMGHSWFQDSRPEVAYMNDGQDLILHTRADKALRFKYVGRTPTTDPDCTICHNGGGGSGESLVDCPPECSRELWIGVNGALGVIQHIEGPLDGVGQHGPGTFEYTDPNGAKYHFFDFPNGVGTTAAPPGSTNGRAAGQLWKIELADGNTEESLDSSGSQSPPPVMYVGASGSAASAIGTFVTYTDPNDQTVPDRYVPTVYDSSQRRWTYNYTDITFTPRGTSSPATLHLISRIKVESGSVSAPTLVAEMDYDYYNSYSSHGEPGDLRMVTAKVPLSGGETSEASTYFRYYTIDISNPESVSDSHEHLVKLIVGPEGVRRFSQAYSNSIDAEETLDDTLKIFSQGYFEYAPNERVLSKASMEFGCGCGVSNGMYEYLQEANPAGGSWTWYGEFGDWQYDKWTSRTRIIQPDSTCVCIYHDADGQILARVVAAPLSPNVPNENFVVSESTPNKMWITKYIRDKKARIVAIAQPDAIDWRNYIHTGVGAGTIPLLRDGEGHSVQGLVTRQQWVHDDSEAEDYFYNAITIAGHSQGLDGDLMVDQKVTYVSGSERGWNWDAGPTATFSGRLVRLMPKSIKTVTTNETQLEDIGGGVLDLPAGSYHETQISYPNFHKPADTVRYATWASKAISVTEPAVSVSENGSGAATTFKRYVDWEGRNVFTMDQFGDRFTYFEYDSATGLLVKRIDDPKAGTSLTSLNNAAAYFGITLPTSGLHLVTAYGYDEQGRLSETTDPAGRISQMYYSKLNANQIVVVSIPLRVDVGGVSSYYSPVSFQVLNLVGRSESSGVISFSGGVATTAPASWINESQSAAYYAMAGPSILSRLNTNIFDETGIRIVESHQYVNLASSTGFDRTSYSFDAMYRPFKVNDPTGTISKTVYDALGRVSEQWTGTSDTNMVKVSSMQYDNGGVGNGYVTQQTQYPDPGNSLLDRVTTVLYDYRGRPIVTEPPVAPFSVAAYDNMGRRVRAATYSDASGLGTTTNPDTPVAARVGYSKVFYDARDQVWKSESSKLNPSDGGVADTLTTLNWYDKAGRLIKTRGSTLSKMTRDRLGAVIKTYALSADNDGLYTNAAYVAADGVAGDTVMEESDIYLDPLKRYTLMSATISRNPGDTATTGALNTGAQDSKIDLSTSGKILGRAQISAFYYDDLDRQTTAVALGDNGGATYDRSIASTAPSSSSSSALVSKTAYDPVGMTLQTTDPMGRVTAYTYDDAGRKTKIVEAQDTTPGMDTVGAGANGDKNRTTTYEYTNGLMSAMTAVLPGTGNNQTTYYVYGVTKDTTFPASKVASNRLLRQVAYPDSTDLPSNYMVVGATDVVKYAYDALGEQVWTKDQAANEITTSYDKVGRQTERYANHIATGFDDLVRKIQMSYDSLGRVKDVTQRGAGDTTIDQVQYTYDSWGNITGFNQDVDSLLSATTTGRSAFTVGYTLETHTPTNGPNMVRRTAMTLNGRSYLSYDYGTTNSINDQLSRVQSLNMGSVTIASYDYMGMGSLVGQTLDQAQLNTSVFASSSGITYPDLDQFNRPTRWNWERIGGAAGGFYDTSIAYDYNSNITGTIDNVHIRQDTSKHLFDVVYANDLLNRLRSADEGNAASGAIQSGYHTRTESWPTMTLTGNWQDRKLDSNGDGDYIDAADRSETNTAFSKANEWTSRRARSTPTQDDYAYTYDAVGNLTQESTTVVNGGTTSLGQKGYVYDAFGRLTAVTGIPVEGEPTYVAKYRYNGLGFRTMWQYDANANGTLEDSERYYFAYDERWRILATYRNSNASIEGATDNPKERYVYHAAGIAGMGGSSYIDSVVLRDRDSARAWTADATGALDERRYYCQNWRGDVVALTKSTGVPQEYVRYSSYGEPTVYPVADLNMDGVVNTVDAQIWSYILGGETNHGVYTPDLDFNDDYDGPGGDDDSLFNESYAANNGKSGVGKVSSDDIGNRIGYAAYQWDPVASFYHVRYRVYKPEIGRWTRRDPLGYVDGPSVYAYVNTLTITFVDPLGLGDWSPPTDDQTEHYFKPHEEFIRKSLEFWLGFVNAQSNAACVNKLMCILKAIAWVESGYGRIKNGDHHGDTDPMQVGYPHDQACKTIGDPPDAKGRDRSKDTPIRRHDTPPTDSSPKIFYPSIPWKDLPKWQPNDKDPFKPGGDIKQPLPYPSGGSDDKEWKDDNSYFWSPIWLLYAYQNKNGKAWNICDGSNSALIQAAIDYNGGGDPAYGQKIRDTLKSFGGDCAKMSGH